MTRNPVRVFPELFDPHRSHEPQHWPFECGEGWRTILTELLSDLRLMRAQEGASIRLLDVKEKLGELRIHAIGPAAAHERIRLATEASRETCEGCGRPSRVRSHAGWLTTLCEACLERVREARR